MGQDYYELLGVPRNASTEEIKRAYKQLALIYHPDRNPGNKEVEERFKEITEAFNTLSNHEARREYDRPPQRLGFWDEYMNNLFRGFDDIFGTDSGRGRTSESPPPPRKETVDEIIVQGEAGYEKLRGISFGTERGYEKNERIAAAEHLGKVYADSGQYRNLSGLITGTSLKTLEKHLPRAAENALVTCYGDEGFVEDIKNDERLDTKLRDRAEAKQIDYATEHGEAHNLRRIAQGGRTIENRLNAGWAAIDIYSKEENYTRLFGIHDDERYLPETREAAETAGIKVAERRINGMVGYETELKEMHRNIDGKLPESIQNSAIRKRLEYCKQENMLHTIDEIASDGIYTPVNMRLESIAILLEIKVQKGDYEGLQKMKGAKDILTGLLYYPEEAEDMINNAFQRAAQNAIRESRYFYELLGIGKTDGLDEPVRIAAVDKALVFIREIETATNRYESRRARGIFQQHMGVETEIVDLYTGIARDEKLPEPSRMKAAARIIERLVEIGDYERVLALKKRDYVPDASKASITDDVMERAVVNNAAGKDELHLENHVRYPLITMTKGLPIESRNYYGILYVNMLASGSVRDDTLLRAINVGGIHGPEEVEAYLTAKTAEEILTTRPKGILWRCKRSARMKEL